MQFHLDGFRAGNPEISGSAVPQQSPGATGPLPAEVDVLIVGSGPTGLTLAAQLSLFPGIRTALTEQKSAPMLLGQADGIACRTVEMFQAFGFAEKALKEAYWVNEISFWKPDDANRNHIVRQSSIQDTEDDLSEFPHLILNQARVHDFYLDFMRNSPTRLLPHYSRKLVDLTVDAAAEYPVTARFEHTEGLQVGTIETIRARHAVGCDGARSVVRGCIGRALHGDSAHQAWGVMDVLAVTDFPDIRRKATIHSASEGSVLVIPREGGYLVRLYVEMDKLADNERVASRQITAERLIAAANRIIRPYTLDVKEVAWWSVYEIGHRICDGFDNVPAAEAGSSIPSVFIAGDACHTHSPKAGQGMNVSMQDAFNLGWKLAAVLQGRAKPALLSTYSTERHNIAQDLIDFDHKWARMFSAPPKDPSNPDSQGVDPEEFQHYFVQQGRFTAGVATRYRPSIICGTSEHQDLARGFTVGMRLHSAPVIRLGDAKPMQLGHAFEADGRWRLIAFAGTMDPATKGSGIHALCEFLSGSPDSPILRHSPGGGDIDSVIDVRAVFQQDFRSLQLEALHPLLRPVKGRYGLADYEKMFCADLKQGSDIFKLRDIDRRGCIVIVRPDQYVAHVLPLSARKELTDFFDAFLLPA